MRIDSITELLSLISQLEVNGIKLPENVKLKIDSPILKESLIKSIGEVVSNFEPNDLDGEFCGVKITFKQ